MLTTLFAFALLQAPSWPDPAVLRAELIVVGKVERVFPVPNPGSAAQKPGAVVIKVSETFVGPEGTSELVVLTHAQVDRPSPLTLGSEALLFLAEADPKGQLRERFVKQGAPDRVPMRDLEGVQRVEGCPWLLPRRAVAELERRGLEARPEHLRTLLAASIASVLPTLEARYVTSGPRSWSLSLARERFVVDGAAHPPLVGDALETVLRAIDGLEVQRLGRELPFLGAPCSSSCTLELRTRGGVHRLQVYPGELGPETTAEQRAAYARFQEFWKLLPGEEKPDLSTP